MLFISLDFRKQLLWFESTFSC